MSFDEKMQEIQKTFTEERVKKFAIMSPALMEQPDYIRSLYLRMLCLLVRSGDMPTDEQVLFVRRLTAGAALKDDFTELMRQSMSMDDESITAFLEAFSSNDLKYYFVVDGCIVCTLGSGKDRFQMLAECAELLGVTKADLQYLSRAAKAIILQSTEAYDEAKRYQTPQVNISLFYHLKNFYTGVIEDAPQILYIYSHNQAELDLTQYHNKKVTKFYKFEKRNKIILDHLTINIKNDNMIDFENCNEVIIQNCTIRYIHEVGSTFDNLRFLDVDKVAILNNRFVGFESRIITGVGNRNFCLSHNTFEQCKNDSSSAICFRTSFKSQCFAENIIIENNRINGFFSNYNYGDGALLLTTDFCKENIVVRNNIFHNCRARDAYARYVRIDSNRYKPNQVIENNTCDGAIKKII